MTISAPASPLPQTATPKPITYGSWQEPAIGGVVTWLGFPGDRWSMTIVTPRLKPEPDARLWTAFLVGSIGQPVRVPFPQPGLSIGSPGSPVVDGAGQSGLAIGLRGLIPGYVVRNGQFLSLTDGTHLFLERATADVTAGSDGRVTVPVWPLLRVSPANGSVANIAEPSIEGRLSGSQDGWTHRIARVDGLQFTVTENR